MAFRTATASIAAGLSTATEAGEAGAAAGRAAADDLRGRPADLAFLFLSATHVEDAEDAVEAVHETLGPRHLVGCAADGVVGGTREVEQGPGAAVWAASLPGAAITPFHATALELDDGVAVAGVPPLDDGELAVLIADPFTFPTAPFLSKLNEGTATVPMVGGIAAGGGEPGAQALILDDESHVEGAVGVVVSGLPVRTVVSQGCAPIGHDLVVTHAEGNVVYELAGKPAFAQLRNEILALPTEQQRLAARGILAGLVIDENRPEYGIGDYLMRAVLGGDDETGALAIGEQVRVGQTLRFHVRDAASADEELRAALAQLGDTRAAGALLFTCNGRGTNMFSEPNHDADAVARAIGTSAVAGFFCGGEIGPVGGRTFLHGFTATLAVFPELGLSG
jgi:small ligand-binding sensory domain FIST